MVDLTHLRILDMEIQVFTENFTGKPGAYAALLSNGNGPSFLTVCSVESDICLLPNIIGQFSSTRKIVIQKRKIHLYNETS